MQLISDNESARRLALSILSEVRLWNWWLIVLGITHGSLREIMKYEIESERHYNFNKRVIPEIVNSNVYSDAVDFCINNWERHYKEREGKL